MKDRRNGHSKWRKHAVVATSPYIAGDCKRGYIKMLIESAKIANLAIEKMIRESSNTGII